MTTEVPEYLQDLLQLVVGQRWPDGDEGQLREVANAWKQAASDLGQVRQDAGDGVTAFTQAAQGHAHDSFMAYWSKTFDNGAPASESAKGGGSMPALPWSIEFCQMMADSCDNMALELETAKDMIIGQLVILFGEIAVTTASAFFDFGASEAAVPEEVAATRGICSQLLDTAVGKILQKILVGALEQALMQGGLDLVIQLKEVAEGNRKTVDWKEFGQAAEAGAINGAVGGAIGGGLGLAGGKLAKFAGSGVGKVAIGAAGGGLGAAATDLVTTGHVSLADVEKGAAAGAIGGALHLGGEHATEGIKGLIAGDGETANLESAGVSNTALQESPSQGTNLHESALSGSTPDLSNGTSAGSTSALHDTLAGLDTFHNGDASTAFESPTAANAGAGGSVDAAGGGSAAHLDGEVTSLAGLNDNASSVDASVPVGVGANEPISVGAHSLDGGDGGSVGTGAFGTDPAGHTAPAPEFFDAGVGGGGSVGFDARPTDTTFSDPTPSRSEPGPTEPVYPEPTSGRTDPGPTEPVYSEPSPTEPTAVPEPKSTPEPTAASTEPAPAESGHTNLASTDVPIDNRPLDDQPTRTDTTSPSSDGSSAHETQPTPAMSDASPTPDARPDQSTPAQRTDPSIPAQRTDQNVPSQRPDQSVPAPRSGDRSYGQPDRPAPDHSTQSDQNDQSSQNTQGQQQQPDPSGGNNQVLITAAAVPGSSFRGHAEAPTTVHVDEIRSGVDAAVHSVVDAYPGLRVEPIDTAPGLYRITDETGVYSGDQRSFTVRVETQRLGDDTAARSILNHDKGAHVIQISDQISGDHVERAVAHEIGEIVADRRRYIVDKLDAFAPDEGNLRPGGPVDGGVKLTPHDAGRVQELRVLGEQLDRIPPQSSRTLEQQEQYEGIHRESMALVEHLGLRDGTPGALERRALVFDPSRLSPDARTHVDSLLRDAGGRPDTLSPDDQQLLRNIHDQARLDQSQFDAHRAGLQPDFVPPIAGDGGKIDPARMHELADQATDHRAEVSKQTLDGLRQQAADAAQRGEYPKVSFQAGGGAALSGRDPGALLVDNRGRWQSDNGDRIAQTADQLRNLRQTGLGDPYQFVGEGKPGDRVPLDAVRYWEDNIAAQGPVIDGTAAFRLENGKLLADITPSDGSPKLTVEVEGTPMIASGFPPEIIPGVDRTVGGIRGAFEKTSAALDALKTPEAAAAKAQIDQLSWQDPASAGHALEILRQHGIDPSALPENARNSLYGLRNWEGLRAKYPGAVVSGDEANLSSVDRTAAKDWIVAGTGGTGISGVENMLKLTGDDTGFTMVGRNPPPGLGDNTQWREVRSQHDQGYQSDQPTAASPRNADGTWQITNPDATGRLKMVFSPTTNITGIDDLSTPGNHRFSVAGVEGDGVISALGSRNAFPPAVADMVDTALKRDPNSVSGRMLFDDDGQYLGYRLTIDGHDVDVTGAASRFFPSIFSGVGREPDPLPASSAGGDGVFSTQDASRATQPPNADRGQWAWQTATNRDAPAEGGNFDGGYVATATQSSHYAAWRRRGTTPTRI